MAAGTLSPQFVVGTFVGASLVPATQTLALRSTGEPAETSPLSNVVAANVQEPRPVALLREVTAPLPPIARANVDHRPRHVFSEIVSALGVLSAAAMVGGCAVDGDPSEMMNAVIKYALDVLPNLLIIFTWYIVYRKKEREEKRVNEVCIDVLLGCYRRFGVPTRREMIAFNHDLECAAIAWKRTGVSDTRFAPFESMLLLMHGTRVFKDLPRRVAKQEKILALHFGEVRIVSSIQDVKQSWERAIKKIPRGGDAFQGSLGGIAGYALMREPDGTTRLYLYTCGGRFRGFDGETTLYSGMLAYAAAQSAVTPVTAYPFGGDSSEGTCDVVSELLADLLGAEHVIRKHDEPHG